MSDLPSCRQCRAPLPDDAPAGLCPKCLVLAGFESEVESGPSAGRSDSSVKPTLQSPAGSRAGFDPPPPEDLAPLFPQLEILELLGKGGMGAVYKARQRGLDRLVAVKILPPEIAHDALFAERFTREARALARLTHSHIVTVYEFGQAGGMFYIVMEYVDGVNLRQTIQAGGLTPQDALAIVPQVCEALQFAHDEGIVHRDIKPENILLDKRGRVKIADFGLAKLIGRDATASALTGTHQVMGTIRYMAPEQMEGARGVDHRADIYSLGVVFYELLTGELPLGRFALPSKTVQVDVRLDEVVLRALEKEPKQRYQNASELKVDIESVSSSPRIFDKPAQAPAGRQLDLEAQVADALHRDKIAAIRLYRNQTGASLAAAKEAVEAIGRLYGVEVRSGARRQRLWTLAVLLAGFAVFMPWLASSGFPDPVATAAFFGASAVLILVLLAFWRSERQSGVKDEPMQSESEVPAPSGAEILLGPSQPPRPGRSVLPLTMALGSAVLCLIGIGSTILSWGLIYNSVAKTWHSAGGLGWWQGMVACGSFGAVFLLMVSTVTLRAAPLWRPLGTAFAGVVVLICSASYILAITHGTLPVQPLLDAASWGIEISGKRPETVLEAQVVARLASGPLRTLCLAVALQILAAIELGGILRRSAKATLEGR